MRPLSDRTTLWILGFCASGTLVALTLAQSVRGERLRRENGRERVLGGGKA
ncbi:hypothetical protein BE221DRAFT_79579 [Ostreococcus tauri]|uniref:Uncharacterized protein n=1 Tax=Ostreococcus tauri TaxID=70448 RepID=A0A1Y5I3R2_OSTTA|nr:hypothetical protein BE221DRAFT_79579 [Ostreococcus tauri]